MVLCYSSLNRLRQSASPLVTNLYLVSRPLFYYMPVGIWIWDLCSKTSLLCQFFYSSTERESCNLLEFKLLFYGLECVLRTRLINVRVTSLHSKESSVCHLGYGSFLLQKRMGREREWRGEVGLHRKEELGKRWPGKDKESHTVKGWLQSRLQNKMLGEESEF